MAFVPAPPYLTHSPPSSSTFSAIASTSLPQSNFFGTSTKSCRILLRGQPKTHHYQPPKCSSSSPSPTPPSSSQEEYHTTGNTYMKKMGALAIQDYLTCRAVRTIIFYCEEFNDGPSKNWLLRFDHFEQREKSLFHNGHQYLMKMLYAPKEHCSVTVGHPRGYFKRQYRFTIDPYRMARRILSAREQLASEWSHDLTLVKGENLSLSRLAFEKMFLGKDGEEDSEKLERKKGRVYDEATFKNQSPLRYKSYQNIKVLTTQHATARLLTHLRDCCNHEYMWLMQFIRSYGPIKNGDDFIQSIMKHEPEIRRNPAFTVVPQSLASQVMSLRVDVAEEWMEVMANVAKDHLDLERSLLEMSVMGASHRIKVESQDFGRGGGSSASTTSFFDPSEN